MTALLLAAALLLALSGTAYEVCLLATSRTRLAEAVTRRLRGMRTDLLTWPAQVEHELAGAGLTASLGVVALGAVLPGVVTGGSLLLVAAVLLLAAVPIAALGGYALPRVLAHGRAERLLTVLRPLFRPWVTLWRAILPAPLGSSGEYRALGRETAALLPGASDEIAMVAGVMTFAERPVREVMTPRTEVVAVPEGASVEEVTRTFAESGYSRLPVYRGTLDEIVGMVHVFDLFQATPGGPLPLRPVAVVPASRACGDLLVEMQRERRHMAVVLDEFGGTLGIVALEDLLRALVGEIYDEDELRPAAEVLQAMPLLEADGALAVAEVEEQFGVRLPGHRATTIGGRVAELAGRIPATGERVVVAGLELDVLRATPTRVERVVIRPAPPPVVRLGD
jgi:CBS domain containing-hemolysin-like protein